MDKFEPPRKPGETAIYEEDPFDLGDIDLEGVKDFLPPPDQLVLKEPGTEEVTITLSRVSIDFFRQKEAELGTPRDRMIGEIIDRYVQAQQRLRTQTNH